MIEREIAGSSDLARPALSETRRTLAFATVLTAFVLEVADSTIVNTALPAIRVALGANEAGMQWIVAAYFLSLGALLLIGGRLGDIYGYRRIFLIGVATFTAASALCGLATSAEQLIAARLLQGGAAAVMTPQVMAIVQVLYSPVERISRLAWFGVVGGLAAILGPIAGGALIEANPFELGWRAIFLINLPIGLGAFLAARSLIPRLHSGRPLRLDAVGALLFALAFASFLAALIQGPEAGWPWWCWALLLVSAVLALSGWRHARRRIARIGSAVIEPALFRLPTFFWGLSAVTVFSAASAGYLLVFAIALQQGLGMSPLETALRHVPFGLGVMAGISLIGRRYLPRFGRWLLVAGALVMASGVGVSIWMIVAGVAGSFLFVAPLLVAGLGMGMMAGPLPPIIVSQVDVAHAGTASATLKVMQQIGGAIGVAAIGGVYLAGAVRGGEGYLSALIPAVVAILACLLAATICAIRLPAVIFGARPAQG